LGHALDLPQLEEIVADLPLHMVVGLGWGLDYLSQNRRLSAVAESHYYWKEGKVMVEER
jgi:hypothetical protein